MAPVSNRNSAYHPSKFMGTRAGTRGEDVLPKKYGGRDFSEKQMGVERNLGGKDFFQ